MTINKLNLPAKANAVQSKINEIIDNLGTSITVDQTYDGTSANPQSGVAINGELTSNYQTKLVSGTNIKTINNTSLLGSGNIDTSELFIAEYGSTTYNQILTAYNAGKEIICRDSGVFFILSGINLNNNVFAFSNNTSTQHILKTIKNNVWTTSVTNVAKSDLSNVSSIDSNSAVQTALDGKADTTLSNVSSIDSNSAVKTALDGKANTNLSNLTSTSSTNFDGQWVSVSWDIKVNYTLAAGATESWTISQLPNDNYTYEVMGTITAKSSGTTAVGIRSALIYTSVCRAVTLGGQSSTFTIPIGTDHKIGLENINSASSVTINYYRVFAYRRIGTNS